jgi:hypothetical protein
MGFILVFHRSTQRGFINRWLNALSMQRYRLPKRLTGLMQYHPLHNAVVTFKWMEERPIPDEGERVQGFMQLRVDAASSSAVRKQKTHQKHGLVLIFCAA